MIGFVTLLMAAAVVSAGCTTSMTNTTTSSTSTEMTTKLNNAFIAQNFSIVTSFMQATNQYGNVVYTGIVKDGQNKPIPQVHNITVEETKSRNETLSRYDAYIAQALKLGYAQAFKETDLFLGTMGNGTNATQSVGIRINEPNSGLTLYEAYVNIFDPHYTICVDYMTTA